MCKRVQLLCVSDIWKLWFNQKSITQKFGWLVSSKVALLEVSISKRLDGQNVDKWFGSVGMAILFFGIQHYIRRGPWETNQNHKKVPCVLCYWFASLVDRREAVTCIWSTGYVSQFLSTKNFIIFFHKYRFNISATAILQLRILQNSFFPKHISLTAFDLYDSYLDHSRLEYTSWLRNIFCANEEAIISASPLFFLNLTNAGNTLFDD